MAVLLQAAAAVPLAGTRPVLALGTQVGLLDDLAVALAALLVTDKAHGQLVENGRDVGAVVSLAPAHGAKTGVAQLLELLESPGRQTGRPDELSVARDGPGWQPHQGHVIGDAVLVIVWMRDELCGVDDLTPGLCIVEVVCPEVDIGAHSADMTITLVVNCVHVLYFTRECSELL